MTEATFVRSGHGYEAGSYGRCTAFDGFEVLAAPMGGTGHADRERRIFGQIDGRPGTGTDYGAYTIKLAKDADAFAHKSAFPLYLLIQHGAGREVWRLPAFYDRGDLREHLLSMPEPILYALLHTIWHTAASARRQAQDETRREWQAAYIEGRIRKRRGRAPEIVPRLDAMDGQGIVINL